MLSEVVVKRRHGFDGRPVAEVEAHGARLLRSCVPVRPEHHLAAAQPFLYPRRSAQRELPALRMQQHLVLQLLRTRRRDELAAAWRWRRLAGDANHRRCAYELQLPTHVCKVLRSFGFGEARDPPEPERPVLRLRPAVDLGEIAHGNAGDSLVHRPVPGRWEHVKPGPGDFLGGAQEGHRVCQAGISLPDRRVRPREEEIIRIQFFQEGHQLAVLVLHLASESVPAVWLDAAVVPSLAPHAHEKQIRVQVDPAPARFPRILHHVEPQKPFPVEEGWFSSQGALRPLLGNLHASSKDLHGVRRPKGEAIVHGTACAPIGGHEDFVLVVVCRFQDGTELRDVKGIDEGRVRTHIHHDVVIARMLAVPQLGGLLQAVVLAQQIEGVVPVAKRTRAILFRRPRW
mmetsp:Transcript_8033/g.30109  ORF Transcript_8033/g.30109 Transcript_8033/m.30109 type:complete len:400 (+) Transcript_8033:461-1660(+)